MKKGVIGTGLVVIGLIGCLLPVAPGIPLVLAGLTMLGIKKAQEKREEKKETNTEREQ